MICISNQQKIAKERERETERERERACEGAPKSRRSIKLKKRKFETILILSFDLRKPFFSLLIFVCRKNAKKKLPLMV
jgi:hypothetical protein